MKVGTIIAGVGLALVAAALTWWVTAGGASTSLVAESPVAESTDRLTPSPTGPHPKVAVKDATYDFGRMLLGETDRHTFVIRNEGEATLQLGQPDMTCQCTVAKQAPTSIPPGESAEITLEWKPTSATDAFDKGARIKTNDPETPLLALAVVGIVDLAVQTEPSSTWDLGSLTGNEEGAMTGYVYSRILKDFEVESCETDSEYLTLETTPMTSEELEERDGLAGTKIDARISGSVPVGEFEETFTVTTNAEEETNQEIEITVEGTRLGPIEFLPTPGTRFLPGPMAIDLGRFPASEGAEGAVFLFVGGMPEGKTLKIESVESTVEGITADLKPAGGAKTGARRRYTLTFRAAPGIAPQTRVSKESARVRLKTNHPEAKEIKFYVEIIAEPR